MERLDLPVAHLPGIDLRTATREALVERVTLLEREREVWEKRVEIYEQRAHGLEELLGELANSQASMLQRLREELSRLAFISAQIAERAALRAHELESL